MKKRIHKKVSRNFSRLNYNKEQLLNCLAKDRKVCVKIVNKYIELDY